MLRLQDSRGQQMVTRKREFNPASYYHVIMRGNNWQNIFRTKEDMYELMRAFLHVHHKYPFTILAFCFMTNHYHVLIKPLKDPLGKIMGLINRRYTTSYSKRYGYIGRLYQKRYFAKEVDTRLGLLAVSSYIHRNPIDTIVPMVEQLEDYPYSSFPLYFEDSKPAPAFLNRELLKDLLPPPLEKTNNSYCEYCISNQQVVEENPHIEDMVPPVL